MVIFYSYVSLPEGRESDGSIESDHLQHPLAARGDFPGIRLEGGQLEI